ncbi:PAS domain S-box protein [Candidatus Thorarchaeota archaeon]|nr:MAG: PAS domain S-box protein [Candidatus Thorarchaeota archaeon]
MGEQNESKINESFNIEPLKLFFDSSPLGVVIFHESKIIHANEFFCNTLGIPHEMINGKEVTELTRILDPEDQESAIKRFTIISDAKRIHDKERYKFRTSDNKVKVLEITGTGINIEGRNYVIAYIEDVTADELSRETATRERKAFSIIAKAALSTEPTKQVCQNVLEGLIETMSFSLGTIRLYDEDSNMLNLVAHYGLKDNEVEEDVHIDNASYLTARTARTKQPLFVSDIMKATESKERMWKAMEIGIRALIFWPILGADEKLLGVINVASRIEKPLEKKDREFIATVADMFATILERRNTEEQLKESQEQFIAFADNMPGPVFIKDHESKIIFVNRFMKEFPQKSYRDNMRNEDLFSQRRAEELTIEDQKVLARGPIERTQETIGRDGEILTYRSNKFPIFREGKPPLIGGFSINITDQVNAEKQREEARIRADFLNDLMSHDLNNMHQGIMASLELMLADQTLSDHLRNIAERALLQVNRSVSLIANVKKLSLVNQVDFILEKTDPANTLAIAIEMVKQSFPGRDIDIVTNIVKNQFCIMANQFLQEVFYNILHNAVKATEADDVKIKVEVSLVEKGEFLQLAFVDWGTGIEDRFKEAMLSGFEEPIRRVSGVGLTLVKQIINQYNGNITVEDRVQGDYTQGSRFIIHLPHGC